MKKIKRSEGITMIKNLFIVTIFILSVSFVSAQDKDYDFSGNWKTSQGPLVLISKTGNTFKGVNVEHDLTVLENLKFQDDKWTATLIKPQDGSKYNCTVVAEGDKLKFTVKKGIMSKTITWIKQ